MDLGTDAINQVCHGVQGKLLEVFGLTAETSFAQSSAAGAD
jgi:hypothetical protein